MTISVFIFFTLFFGLTVKQMAQILMFGSFFISWRHGIKDKLSAARGWFARWFWGKMNQLITCHLCLTAQLSFWFFVLPATLVLYWLKPHLLSNLLDADLDWRAEICLVIYGMFIESMVIGAVATAFWNFSEYPSKKLEILKDFYAGQLEIERERITFSGKGTTAIDLPIHPPFNLEDFQALIVSMDEKCLSIGCATDRRDCRRKTLDSYLNDWFQVKNCNDLQYKLSLSKLLKKTSVQYYSEHDFSTKAQEEVFKKFLKKIP